MQPQALLTTRLAPVLLPTARDLKTAIAEDDGAAIPRRRASFAVPDDLGLGPVPRSLGPMRAPRSWVPDVVRHEKLPGGLAITTSLLETAGLTMVLCDPVNTLVVPSAHVLHYQEMDRDGRVRDACHRPQVVARRRDGGVVAYTFLATWERDRAAPIGRGPRRRCDPLTVRWAWISVSSQNTPFFRASNGKIAPVC